MREANEQQPFQIEVKEQGFRVITLQHEHGCFRGEAGETPPSWSERKRRHKDVDAAWIRRHGVSHCGHEKDIGMDRATVWFAATR